MRPLVVFDARSEAWEAVTKLILQARPLGAELAFITGKGRKAELLRKVNGHFPAHKAPAHGRQVLEIPALAEAVGESPAPDAARALALAYYGLASTAGGQPNRLVLYVDASMPPAKRMAAHLALAANLNPWPEPNEALGFTEVTAQRLLGPVDPLFPVLAAVAPASVLVGLVGERLPGSVDVVKRVLDHEGSEHARAGLLMQALEQLARTPDQGRPIAIMSRAALDTPAAVRPAARDGRRSPEPRRSRRGKLAADQDWRRAPLPTSTAELIARFGTEDDIPGRPWSELLALRGSGSRGHGGEVATDGAWKTRRDEQGNVIVVDRAARLDHVPALNAVGVEPAAAPSGAAQVMLLGIERGLPSGYTGGVTLRIDSEGLLHVTASGPEDGAYARSVPIDFARQSTSYPVRVTARRVGTLNGDPAPAIALELNGNLSLIDDPAAVRLTGLRRTTVVLSGRRLLIFGRRDEGASP